MAEQKRWRAEIGGKYWIAHDDFTVCEHTDDGHRMDDINYKNGNYFRTEEEAQAAAKDMRKVLLRHAGELHDFTWAVEKLRKGKILLRKSWLEEGATTKLIRIHYDCLQDLSDKMRVVSCDKENTLLGADYAFLLEEVKATDWEIYEEPTE